MNKKELLNKSDAQINRIIKIQGTNFDRRRKLTLNEVAKIRDYYFNKNISIAELAKKYKVSYHTIKYNVDDDYRYKSNFRRNFYNVNSNIENLNERITYKKELIKKNKIKLGDLSC